MLKDGDGWPPIWDWMLQIERRLSRLEAKGRTPAPDTSREDDRTRWAPRDYLMAGAGVSMVIGALSEKSGLTTVGLTILKAAARVYGEH